MAGPSTTRDCEHCLENIIIVRSYMFRTHVTGVLKDSLLFKDSLDRHGQSFPPLFSLAYYSQQHVHQVPGMVCIASKPAHPCLSRAANKATCWAIEKWIFCHFGYQVGALFTLYLGIRIEGRSVQTFDPMRSIQKSCCSYIHGGKQQISHSFEPA